MHRRDPKRVAQTIQDLERVKLESKLNCSAPSAFQDGSVTNTTFNVPGGCIQLVLDWKTAWNYWNGFIPSIALTTCQNVAES
mmetsp:Transcript_41784/g.64368  ORF Transcript_41784/g.64368 Transcript_41784/m.64368 type:complete len:82 (+) Transcript_41784:220-465(+)